MALNFAIPDYSAAKRIILGIVQENGGSFAGRTAMFKAFYHAHVAYWKKHGKHLSSHPIIRMGNGPAIDNWLPIFQALDGQWARSGREEQYAKETYVLPANSTPVTLSKEEQEAVRFALNKVRGKGVTTLSRESHGVAWSAAKRDGDELAICLDGMTSQKYAETKASIEHVRSEFDAA